MTIKLKPDNGLALNQNIVLEQFFRCNQYVRGHGGKDHGFAKALGLTPKQLKRACVCLKNRGYLSVTRNYCWEITDEGIRAVDTNDYIKTGPFQPHTGIRKPPQGTLSSYIWAALRAKKTATVAELLSLAPIEDEDHETAANSARRLLYWLCKTNIVRRLPRKKQGLHYNSRGHTRYRLSIDLGPRHPVIRQRKHEVYDPNSRTNLPFKDVLTVLKDPLKAV